MDSNTSPLLDFVHDELIDTNASLGGIFEELPLPEQLLQSDEKDSNSLDSMHQSGLSRSLELMKAAEAVEAAESNLPDQIKVNIPFCASLRFEQFSKKKKNLLFWTG